MTHPNQLNCFFPDIAAGVIRFEQMQEATSRFLQGQVSADIREVHNKQTRRAAHCNPKGRVLSSFRILLFQEYFYLVSPVSMTTIIMEQLKKYAVFSRFTFCEVPAFKVMGCVGEETVTFLSAIFGEVPVEVDQCITLPEAILIRVQGDTERFEIVGTGSWMAYFSEKFSEKYAIGSARDWRYLEISLGISNIYPETRALFTPHMLNYPALNAVSFKKGCYTGQEIISRTEYLGKTKRYLHHLTLHNSTPFLLGENIYNHAHENIGILVDVVPNGTEQYYDVLVLSSILHPV